MRNFKIYEFGINGKIAHGIINGMWYRVAFDRVPTEQEAKRALREAASYNIA